MLGNLLESLPTVPCTAELPMRFFDGVPPPCVAAPYFVDLEATKTIDEEGAC